LVKAGEQDRPASMRSFASRSPAVAFGFAELSPMFWLIVFRVNAERWKEQAGITEGSV
jgi:hypothetical protein